MSPSNKNSLCLALALGLATGLAPAQGPGTNPPLSPAKGDPVSVLRAAHGLFPRGRDLAGGGADYEVTFANGGMEYVPALGRRAAKNHPFRLHLESIRRGGSEVVAAAVAPSARQDGGAAVFDRAPGITERFDVRADGVELSYHFERALPGAGDLVVRLRVDTDLIAAPADASAGELRFLADGIGGVRVGRVTGVDGAGRRAAGTLRFDGNCLQLGLPASFVDRAVYPLVLDPLIGTEIVFASGYDDIHPDIAYDVTNDNYLLVWQREFSATSVQIRAQRLDASGTPVGNLLLVTSVVLPNVNTNPTVASVNQTDQFLICWQQGPSVFGPWDIYGASVGAATVLPSAIVVAADPASEITPDAGGEATTNGDHALVVWHQVGAGIRGARVQCPAGGLPVPAPAVAIASSSAYDKPAISKNGGALGRHLVVYRHAGIRLQAAIVDRFMNVTGGAYVTTTSTDDEPDCDGDGTDFMVAWQRPEPGSSDRDVYCQLLHYDSASSSLSNVGAAVAAAKDANEDEMGPTVAFLGPKYALAWADERVGSSLAYDVVVRERDPKTCFACGPEYCLGCTSGRIFDFDPQIASRVSGGATDDQGLVVFASADGTPPFASEVRAQQIEALGVGGPLTDLGGGCGQGGVAGGSGPFAIGNSTFRFTLSGARPAVTAAAFALNGTVAPLSCGACKILPPLIFVGVPISSGAASITLPVPCNLWLPGQTIEVQWTTLVPGLVPCASVRNVAFSNRLQATVGY